MTLTILHEGKAYVVIDKPAGIAVEKNFDNDTVEARALVQWRRPGSTKLPYVGIVHRLDRPVSGCLLLAKNKSTLRLLNKAFEEKKVDKTYLARTAAPLPSEKGSLKHYLSRDETGRRAMASERPLAGAKESLLDYKLVGRVEEDYLYAITPVTGRFHQIRVQLATAGAPIIGDVAYGSEREYLPECICLRAVRLGFLDPHSGEKVVVEASAVEWEDA